MSRQLPGWNDCLPRSTGLVVTASDGVRDHVIAYRHTPLIQLYAKSETFRTDAEAKTGFRRRVALQTAQCFSQTLYDDARLELPQDPDLAVLVGAPSTRALELPAAGNELRAYEFSLPVDSSKGTVTFYFDYAVFRVRRGVGSILTITALRPFDTTFLAAVIAKAADRGAKTASA